MGKSYITGNQTKEKIIKEAKRLLYIQGFSNTTYDHISHAADINRALIPYHFKSKQSLGQTIYAKLLDDFLTRLDSILDINEFSDDFISILHITAYYRLLENLPFSRFLKELQADTDFSVFMEDSEQILLEGLLKSNKKLTTNEIHILLVSEIGMKKELIRMVCDHQCDIDTIAKIQLYMILSYTGYSKKKIEELYDSAMQVIDLLSFQITQDFDISISFK